MLHKLSQSAHLISICVHDHAPSVSLLERLLPTICTHSLQLELALAARTCLNSDWGIGESGVAGPAGNSRGITPGVSALAVAGPGGVTATRLLFPDATLSSERDAYGEPAYRCQATS